jgi:hypothetical protein
MLLDSRDIERGIDVPVRLSLTEKLVLLRSLAYWLVRNGHTDVSTADAETRITAKLRSMGQIDVPPQTVFRHLLDRGGVLREPVPGQIDFVHRTFQEYLAAQAAVEEDDIGILTANAHLDEWREVVVLAAGHAHPAQRERLLDGILKKEPDEEERLKLDLVALACLETSPELNEQLRNEIEDRAGKLIPPRSFDEARVLAAAGEFVLDLLADTQAETPAATAATIRTIALIGGPGALELLTRYREAQDEEVVDELIEVRQRFDLAEFAERVLADLPIDYLLVGHPADLVGLEHIRCLKYLECDITEPDELDLAPLAGTSLESIRLTTGRSYGSTDIGTLAAIATLREITADVPTHGWARLAELPSLEYLRLSHIEDIGQLAELAPLRHLPALSLNWVSGLEDLQMLSFLDRPHALSFRRCLRLRDLETLRRWAGSLTELSFAECPDVDLSLLPALTGLRVLELVRTPVPDLRLVAGLGALRELRLHATSDIDLSPFSDRPDLKVTVTRPTQVFD